MSNSVYCDFIYQDSKPNHNKFVIIKGKHGQFIYCERSDKKSFKGLTIGDLKWDLITNDYFDEEWDQLLIRRYDTDMADSYAEAIGDEVELTRLKPRDVIDIVTKADDEIRYSSQDNFTNDLMEKLTELSKDNDLREELSALKASKDTIKTEVNALRDEVMALKDWKGLRERYDKELREEMMALKASKETIETDFCELREELNEMKSRCLVTDYSSGGNGSHNSVTHSLCGNGSPDPLIGTSGEQSVDINVIEMFTEIRNHMKITINMLNGMNGSISGL